MVLNERVPVFTPKASIVKPNRNAMRQLGQDAQITSAQDFLKQAQSKNWFKKAFKAISKAWDWVQHSFLHRNTIFTHSSKTHTWIPMIILYNW